MDTNLHGADTRNFGSELIRAISLEIYTLCYPIQSLNIPLEDRKPGSQWYINNKAIAVLQSMGIEDNRLDSITVAEAIYNQRWAGYPDRTHFLSLPKYMQQEYLDIADRMVKLVLSGDYHA